MKVLPFYFSALLLLTASCSSIECPLNSLVYTQYQLMRPDGSKDTLTQFLSVYTNRAIDGNDSILINLNTNTTELALPISYSQPQDVFYFEMIDTIIGYTLLDTVTVAKVDKPHFESVECSPLFFHTITSVSTTHNAIDSIVIKNPDVSYDTSKKHLYIYFKSRN